MAKTIKRRQRDVPQKSFNPKKLTLRQIQSREYDEQIRKYSRVGEADYDG